MNKLHDYITIIKTVDNFEEAIKTFNDAIINYGFDYYIFSQANIAETPAILNHKYYKTTFPSEWQERYVEQEYFSIDPIHLKLITSQDPFYWSEYIQTITPSTSQMLMMHDAQKYGLVDGLAASYLRQGGDSYFVSIARQKMIADYDPALLSALYLLSSCLVTAYEKSEAAKTSSTTLTPKEQNIINLAAIGKTDAEIATISHISVNTVRYHWKNVFKKLETNNRVFAVIRAINSGLIRPEQFELTTNNGSSISYKTDVD